MGDGSAVNSMRRFDDWTVRLDAYLSWMAEEAFSWGANDCVLFVRNCIREMTGEDLARGFHTRYNDRKSALRLLGKEGLEPIIERIAAEKKLLEIRARFAQRGDAVLVDTDLGPALAIVDLTGERALAPGPHGLTAWNLSLARRAWRI